MGKVRPKPDAGTFPVSKFRTGAMVVSELKWDLSNGEFAAVDKHFQKACAKAGVAATARQASKWRNQIGAAYAKG